MLTRCPPARNASTTVTTNAAMARVRGEDFPKAIAVLRGEGVDASGAQLVSGSVVISSDYFKTFVAGFRAFFGGRFRGYETLLERARRDALWKSFHDAARSLWQ